MGKEFRGGDMPPSSGGVAPHGIGKSGVTSGKASAGGAKYSHLPADPDAFGSGKAVSGTPAKNSPARNHPFLPDHPEN